MNRLLQRLPVPHPRIVHSYALHWDGTEFVEVKLELESWLCGAFAGYGQVWAVGSGGAVVLHE